jgi:flagellar hook-associated protein 3 FlgL
VAVAYVWCIEVRISSANAFESSVANLQKRQRELSETQERLTSGKRVSKPSDDPAAAAQAERALASQSRSQAQQRALAASRDAMQQTESTLGSAGELMQQVREQLIGAGNGSLTDAERRILGESIRNLRNDLFSLANRSDGAGRYLFGGQGSDGPPFADAPGGVVYDAASGQLQAASGEATALTVDGRAAWLLAADPANPGGTLSVFDTLDRVVGELLTPGRSSADVALTVSTGLRDIDAGSANLSAWRSHAGDALNRIEGIADRLSQTVLDAQRQRSDAEDLDMLQAISEFQNRQTGYDAALKTYSIVQKMSLFDYLR